MAQTFERFEQKYLLDQKQFELILNRLKKHVKEDEYPHSRIRSIYYDTDVNELIRRSIEKPEYKEKIRIRSYDEADDDDKIFVEFKKKFNGIVYKRRTKARCGQALKDIYQCEFADKQVSNEIRYALSHYEHLHPCIFIRCDRASYISKDNPDIRITFDTDMKYRLKNLSLHSSDQDKSLTDKTIMELKVKDAIPLWLSEILDEAKAYPNGFSKVGNAFMKELKEFRS